MIDIILTNFEFYDIIKIEKLEGGENMDINAIIQFISSVGFPIACCAYLFYENHTSREKHKEEMDNMSTAINNNTIALTKLLDKLDNEKE